MLKQFLFGFAFAAMALVAVPSSHAANSGAAAQTTDIHGIKVTVTPPDFAKPAQNWEFAVALETHTRDLGDELVKVSTLVADGKRYTPIEWKGAAPGGHHRKGSLHFKAVSPQPSAVELQIHLSGEAVPRSFRWILKGTGNGK
ncbi:MAG TPA: hypothetical protein VFK88_10140 [Gallionella sp.]|nr:hypothetical protein [Gallionella sp.]